MRRIIIPMVAFFCVLLVCGCSTPAPEVKIVRETVEVRVEVPVTVVVTSIVTAEPLPTYTPYPTYTPVPRPTEAPTAIAEEEPSVSEDVLRFDDILEEQDRGGVVIRVTGVTLAPIEMLLEDEETSDWFQEYADEGVQTVGALGIEVENLTDQIVSIYPDQGVVLVGNEQVDTDLWLSDDVGGDMNPGILKDGAVVFMLERSVPEDISTVRYQVDAAFDEDYDDISDAGYDFTLDLK